MPGRRHQAAPLAASWGQAYACGRRLASEGSDSRTRSWAVVRATSWVVRPCARDASSVSMVLARSLFEMLSKTAAGSGRHPSSPRR